MTYRVVFLSLLIGTALCMFFASSIEYRGFEYMKPAGVLASAAAVGTLALITLAIWMFLRATSSYPVLEICCLAGMPFVVGWRLSGQPRVLRITSLIRLEISNKKPAPFEAGQLSILNSDF
jgi:hypothetical protein